MASAPSSSGRQSARFVTKTLVQDTEPAGHGKSFRGDTAGSAGVRSREGVRCSSGAQWGQQGVSQGAPGDAVGTSKGCCAGQFLSFRPFCSPGAGEDQPLSADTRGRNCCLPSCCTRSLCRFLATLNGSILLHQYPQLGSPVPAVPAQDGGSGRGMLAMPAGHSLGGCWQWDQGLAAKVTLPPPSPALLGLLSLLGCLVPHQPRTDFRALDPGVPHCISDPRGWSSAKAQCPETNHLALHTAKCGEVPLFSLACSSG